MQFNQNQQQQGQQQNTKPPISQGSGVRPPLPPFGVTSPTPTSPTHSRPPQNQFHPPQNNFPPPFQPPTSTARPPTPASFPPPAYGNSPRPPNPNPSFPPTSAPTPGSFSPDARFGQAPIPGPTSQGFPNNKQVSGVPGGPPLPNFGVGGTGGRMPLPPGLQAGSIEQQRGQGQGVRPGGGVPQMRPPSIPPHSVPGLRPPMMPPTAQPLQPAHGTQPHHHTKPGSSERSAAGGSSGQQQQPGPKIDPAQIPRQSTAISDEAMDFSTRLEGKHNQPPRANYSYWAYDDGNCAPRYMRLTLNSIPHNEDLLKTSSMPLALLCAPLATPHPQERPIPLIYQPQVQVEQSPKGGVMDYLPPIRCQDCQVYINPFVIWSDYGRKWKCNFCNSINTSPQWYQGPSQGQGYNQVGFNQGSGEWEGQNRLELIRGSVEFIAPKTYQLREPMECNHLFLIDVSQSAIQRGLTSAISSAISQSLEALYESCNFTSDGVTINRARVGVATFDSQLQFFNFKSGQSGAQMMVVPEIENDTYGPLVDHTVVSLSTFKEQIQSLLNNIPQLFSQQQVRQSCGGAAISAAIEMLKPVGGKIHAFFVSPPEIGTMKTDVQRGMQGQGAGDDPKIQNLGPRGFEFESLGVTASESMTCLDVYTFTDQFYDLASWSAVVRKTGGSMYRYSEFNPAVDQSTLVNDLRWNLSRAQALEAVFKVRTSRGVSVTDYYGNFYRPTQTSDIFLSAMDAEKCITVSLTVDEKLNADREVYLQSALLYTSVSGQRRIRVHTLAVPTGTTPGQIFKGADLDSIFNYYLKLNALNLFKSGLRQLHDDMTSQCVNALYAYRKHCASVQSSGQLILPEGLKLLPLYMLAMQKMSLFRQNIKGDERSVHFAHLMSADGARGVTMVVPRLFDLRVISDTLDDIEIMMLSSQSVDQDGMYLMTNGSDALIMIGINTQSAMIRQLLNVDSLDQLVGDANAAPGGPPTPPPLTVPVLDNAINRNFVNLMNKLRKQYGRFMRLRICKRSDVNDVLFHLQLVEDRNVAGMSYVEYLCHVHRLIQNKMIY